MTADDQRSIVLVAGSGRSGTSLIAGMLQRLGMRVPPPEIPADPTNPRGFAESQWVVDFHTRLLREAGVQVSDGRPAAWARTADRATDDDVAAELRTWLAAELRRSEHLVIKDPRLSWFLGLWRRCAEDLGVTPRFVTMLRHPAAVVDSKQRWYGGNQGVASRTTGWLNQTLYTERATRGAQRVFVGYDDLLDDWTAAVGRVGRVLDLGVVVNAQAPALLAVQEFVDPTLRRSAASWGNMPVPERLRDLADAVWTLVSGLLIDGTADTEAETARQLDGLREAYIGLYEEAEGIAQSSIVAARRRPGPVGARLPRRARLARRLPRWLRHAVPVGLRVRMFRLLSGRRAPAVVQHT